MATLTTLPVGFGYFLGYFPANYAVAIGSQLLYDALPDGTKSKIKGGYSDAPSFLTWLNATTLTEPLEIILLEPMDTSGIPSSKDGWAITITKWYLKFANNSFHFGYRYGY